MSVPPITATPVPLREPLTHGAPPPPPGDPSGTASPEPPPRRSDSAGDDVLTLADEGARLRRTTRLLFAGVWVVPGIIAGVLVWYAMRGRADGLSLGAALAWQIAAWMIWGLWSQLILTLVARLPLVRGGMRAWASAHVLACTGVISLSVLYIAWLDRLFSGSDGAPFAESLRSIVVRHLDFELVLYWAVLGAAYMVEYLRRYRERDRAAYELEQKLARQQLEALRMQLNPHFLFNALNSVTELMESDVRTAQRALTAVSDLLRLSLRSAGSSLIPLWQEIELVELYLQVARVRYGDSLTIDIEVDPAAVDVLVPSFVLQPMVENALKHGISPAARDQHVAVAARRDGAMLALTVEDNGRGLDGRLTDSGRFLAARRTVEGLGIGLTNTRTRLAILYGDRYAFRMTNRSTGGARVEIRLPLDP